jgi:hypothetical protein
MAATPSAPGATIAGATLPCQGVASERSDRSMTHGIAFWFRAFVAVLRRPDLWWTAVRQFGRTVPRRWWRRPPYLPVPDAAYVRFRLETAYGNSGRARSRDVIRYLEWARTAA